MIFLIFFGFFLFFDEKIMPPPYCSKKQQIACSGGLPNSQKINFFHGFDQKMGFGTDAETKLFVAFLMIFAARVIFL